MLSSVQRAFEYPGSTPLPWMTPHRIEGSLYRFGWGILGTIFLRCMLILGTWGENH